MSATKEIDEDGWTLVTKLNKKRRARGRVDPKAEKNSTVFLDKAEKNSTVSQNDFYTFKKEEEKLQRMKFYLKYRRNSKMKFKNTKKYKSTNKKNQKRPQFPC